MKTPRPLDPATERLMRWAEEEALKVTEKALGYGVPPDESEESETESNLCQSCERALRKYEMGWCERCIVENGDAFSEREQHDLDIWRDK